MLKLVFYVPENYLESVKNAVFTAGAGRIGQYERCCWQIKGQGQFKPMPGSQPFIGEQGGLECIDEYKVEMVCDDNLIEPIIAALKQAHPFEEPAYQVLTVLNY